jgi:uncharacterized membrane protein
MTPEVYGHIASSPAIMTHIAAGVTGIFSGTVALFSRKGALPHRVAGTVFFISILMTGALASYLAVLIHQKANIVGGIFTCYLVATAWLTVRRKEGHVGAFERVAILVPIGVATALLILGLQGMSTPTQTLDGSPAQASLFLAGVAALAAAMDFKVIRSGGISGAPRIARHLWRMCFGFFIATGSFFIGQQKVMPVWMHGSPILLALGVAPLVLLVFWLVRVRLTNWYDSRAASR